MPDPAVSADREGSAAAMEACPAAKAMKTFSPSKPVESRSIGREARGGRNGGGPEAVETPGRAAKVMKSGNAAGVCASAAGAKARSRRAAAVNMVRRAGITRMAGQVLDGICLARSRTVGLVEVPTIAAADGGAAVDGRILRSFDRREALQRPKPICNVIARASFRPACQEQQGNAQGSRNSFACHRTFFLMATQRRDRNVFLDKRCWQ
jgi:hypothetical protein